MSAQNYAKPWNTEDVALVKARANAKPETGGRRRKVKARRRQTRQDRKARQVVWGWGFGEGKARALVRQQKLW